MTLSNVISYEKQNVTEKLVKLDSAQGSIKCV